MAKRTIAVCAIILTVITCSTADAAMRGSDGCRVLGTVVYEQVARNTWIPSIREWGWGGEFVCAQTTKTVTAAFTRAMASQNIFVSWSGPGSLPGDACLSHYLSQCYPGRHPGVPPQGNAELAYMYDAWRAVYSAVAGTMVLADTDDSRFHAAALRGSLRRAMSVSTRGAASDYR